MIYAQKSQTLHKNEPQNCFSGTPKFVRLGNVNLYAQPQNFTISRIIRHPDHNFAFAYNDIALLQLDRPVQINDYVRPACLYLNHSLPSLRLPVATGWKATNYLENAGDDLIKVVLEFTPKDNCSRTYESLPRFFPKGIASESQFCAGYNVWQHTCQVSDLKICDPLTLTYIPIFALLRFLKSTLIKNCNFTLLE